MSGLNGVTGSTVVRCLPGIAAADLDTVPIDSTVKLF